MNKKKYLFTLIIILLISLSGCKKEWIDSPVKNKKPTTFYYTAQLSEFINENTVEVTLFETNLNKDVEVSKENKETLYKFISNLKKENFLSPKEDLSKKPKYKLFIKLNNEKKYVINIFDEIHISVHPWDGVYLMDNITMEGIPTAYNLYKLCEFILNK